MAAGSIEYEVLVRHTVDLQLAVEDNLIPLSCQLVAAEIITPDQFREIRHAYRPVNERGADLVEYVQNKVRQDPRHYHAFIGALQSDLSQYGDILMKLEQTWLSVASERQSVIPQPPTPREDDNQLPAQGSVEYEILIHHTVDLQLAVKENLIPLSGQLVAAQLITPDQDVEIRNGHRPVNERGADLVGYVQTKVHQDPRHYHAFIGALRSDLSRYGDILAKLEQTRLSVASEQQPVTPQPSSSVQEPGGQAPGANIGIQRKTSYPLPIPPIVSQLTQPWHDQVNPDLRQHLVKKLVEAIYPVHDPLALQDPRVHSLVQYAMKVEKEMFEAATDREEYYKLLAQKIYHIRRELEDRKNQKKPGASSTSATRLNDSDHSTIYEKLAPHAAKWRDIGRELGFRETEMDTIQSNPMLLTQSPQSWLRAMLSQWLQWVPGDGRGSTGFATRESLRAALLRANLGQLAQQFHTPSEGDQSHERSGDHTPQHSSQAEGRDQHTVKVPSGHILTKEELQVLGAILATNSDEKLKSIRLSLQEQQEIRKISREEVEKSLRQSGVASGIFMADALKDRIEKGIEDMKHYEAYEQALEGGLKLTLRYLKFLFLGPPRSGKTSTRRRLIKEIINLRELGVPSKSTGTAETNDVIIKKLTSESVAITKTEWKSMKSSKKGTQLGMDDEKDLAQLFYQLIYNLSTSTTPVTSSEPTPMQDSNEHSKSEAPDASNPTIVPISINNPTEENTKQDEQSDNATELERLSDTEKSEIDNAFKNLTTILRSDSPEDLKQLLEDLTMINMADVGGQPAFLDMLPALTIGPALYLLFFRLDQGLKELCPVRFLQDEKEEEAVLETSYCTEEVIYQCLASIACFSSHSQADAKATVKSTASSRALLFGTYKDKIKDKAKISQIQRTLNDTFTATELFKKGLLLRPPKSKNLMAFTVDNMEGTEDSEMADIRKKVEGIIKKYFPSIPIPVSWLMFRVIVNLLNKPVLSLTQCEEIAKRLSMPTSVEEAIWFFHHNIGSLMHYPDIRSMKDTVICHPQVIFDSISKLIIDKFQEPSITITAGEIEEFHQRGLFTLSHIQDTTKHPQNSLLKLNQLVDVLKHHNILTEVKQDKEITSSSEPEPEPKFIMPAVMKYASEDELLSPSSAVEAMASPIFVHFAGGFVPFGVFCAGVTHLIHVAQLDSMSPRWKLCDNQVMRNKAKFIIDGAFFVTLVSRPQYIMVHVEKHSNAECTTTPKVICFKIRKTVVQALEIVILNMKYKPYRTLQVSMEQPFELAFTCNLEDSHCNHLMTITMDDNGHVHHAECSKNGAHPKLKDEHLIWFKDKQNINSGPHSEILASPSTPNGQHGDQQPSERDHSHDGSRGHAPQHSGQMDESNEGTVNGNTSVTRLNDSDHSWIYKKLALHAAKWRDIGRELSFKEGEMNNIQSNPMLMVQAPKSFLSEMLSQWLQWAPGDGRGSTGSATRESLRVALLKANLGQLAQAPSGQHSNDQQSSERDHSHDGSRDHAPQHSGQAERRDECTVNDYPSRASVQQPQSPPTVQTPVDVCLQSLAFSKDMSNEQLALWLRNHPSLSGTDYEEDISKLTDARINGHIFLNLSESRLEHCHVSLGFQFAIMDIIKDMKSSPSSERLPHDSQHCDQQPIPRKRSHEGSRGHTPQHSSQAEGRDQHTDNAIRYYADSSPPAKRRKQS